MNINSVPSFVTRTNEPTNRKTDLHVISFLSTTLQFVYPVLLLESDQYHQSLKNSNYYDDAKEKRIQMKLTNPAHSISRELRDQMEMPWEEIQDRKKTKGMGGVLCRTIVRWKKSKC